MKEKIINFFEELFHTHKWGELYYGSPGAYRDCIHPKCHCSRETLNGVTNIYRYKKWGYVTTPPTEQKDKL